MLNSSVCPRTVPSEETRLAALFRYHILDTPADPVFDRLAELTASLFAVCCAGITFVDADRVWFKACFGLSLHSLPLTDSLCEAVLEQDDVFVVEDVAREPRFQNSPLFAGPPRLRFYAAAPLRTLDGLIIGSLCLADAAPRSFSAEERVRLTYLAAVVMREVEQQEVLRRSDPPPASAGKPQPLSSLVPVPSRSRPRLYRRLQRAYNDLESWAAQRTAALERANRALEHEVVERERVEAALQAVRAELESRVIERTAALERANQELRGQIAERREAELRLEESKQRYKSLFEQNLDAVYSFNREGRFLSANAACESLCGHSVQDLLQMSFLEIIVPEEREEAWEMFQRALQGVAQHGELTITHKDGRRIEISCSKMPIVIGQKVVGTYGISRDITAHKQLEWERERLLGEALARADRDPLTGLLNHAAFQKRFQEEVVQARQAGQTLTVALLDVDDFRFFNDAHGHITGDEVLRRVARALEELAGPETGTALARFGGDEFAVLLPAADLMQADALARALGARLDHHPTDEQTSIPLSLSVGVACFPDDGATRLEILGVADARLRRAKAGVDEQAERLRMTLARSLEGFTMLDALVTAVDNKDRYTRRHSDDVLTYSRQIAEALGLDERTQRHLQTAALLHDVGKIGVPDAILRKPGRLTDEEFAAIKQHPMMGAIIVGAVPGFEETLDAIRHHHERWDGGGYPFGLKGEEIPLPARLMAVADAYSAMTTDRPYRKGMSVAQALAVLEQGQGSQWDPACVQALLRARA